MTAKLRLTGQTKGYKLEIDGFDISNITTGLYIKILPGKKALAIIDIPCDIEIPEEISVGLSIYMKDKDFKNDSEAKSIQNP